MSFIDEESYRYELQEKEAQSIVLSKYSGNQV